MQKYTKALIAALGVVLTLVNAAYGNDPRVQAVIGLLTVLGIYHFPNKAA